MRKDDYANGFLLYKRECGSAALGWIGERLFCNGGHIRRTVLVIGHNISTIYKNSHKVGGEDEEGKAL